MKAWLEYADDWNDEKARVIEINELDDLLNLMKKEDCDLILSENDDYHAEPFVNKKCWEVQKAKGVFDCKLSIKVYNDYIE